MKRNVPNDICTELFKPYGVLPVNKPCGKK